MLFTLFSPPDKVKNELVIVKSFFKVGLETYHLRKPNHTHDEVQRYLQCIPEKFHPNIVLHNHHILSHNFNLKGIHFPAVERVKSNISELLTSNLESRKKTISSSFHSIISLTLENLSPFDYVFFSPVFASVSKPGHWPKVDFYELSNHIQKLKSQGLSCKVLALGGITPASLAAIMQSAFDGVGILGSVWQAANPLQYFVQINDEINKLNRKA